MPKESNPYREVVEEITVKLRALRARRSELNKQYEETRAAVSAAEVLLIDALKALGETTAMDGISFTRDGVAYQVNVEPDEVPTVDDWDSLYNHIVATKQFDLLHKRVTASAITERWRSGEEVPGVGHVPTFKVKLKARETKGK